MDGYGIVLVKCFWQCRFEDRGVWSAVLGEGRKFWGSGEWGVWFGWTLRGKDTINWREGLGIGG